MSRPAGERLSAKRKQIGERLRALRQTQGIAQARMGEILGIDQSHVSNIERGIRSVTIEQLTKLSKAFGVSIDALLGDRGDQRLKPPRSLRSGRLLRRLQRIEELPVAQQRAVLKILDGLLEQHGGNGRR